jgi:hypothetical protein
MQPWVKWLVNRNMKFIVFIVWLIALPAFLLAYIENAADDALHTLKEIKQFKKD